MSTEIKDSDKWVAGGFYPPENRIDLFADQLASKQHAQDTIVHELIHAFDQCTARVDWTNCLHLACSEVRAASLSGDCKLTREMKRGYLMHFFKHHQQCVYRRAVLSLKQSPHCGNDNVPHESVMAVWDSCFADTAPFDEIY